MSEWSRARVNIDYHVVFDANLYSVPYNLVHEMVEIRATTVLAWLRTCAAAAGDKRSRITSTGLRVIKLIWNGRRRAWCIGHRS
jgi:hypothetical protein